MPAGDSNSPVFDFTSVDFEGLERDLIKYAIARLDQNSAGLWTNLNASGDLRRLLELFAYAGDLVSYSENAHVLETLIKTLVRRKNFIRIATPFGFKLFGRTPATTRVRLFISPGSLPLAIPKGSQVADAATGQIIYESDADATATTEEYDIDFTQGTTISAEAVGVSDGSVNQEYALAEPLVDGTLEVLVGATTYTEVSNLVEGGPTSEVFTLRTDEQDVTYIQFGDGITGRVPPNGQAITATYRTCDGALGNQPVGAIDQVISMPAGVLNVSNITDASGGGPRQTLLSGKRNFPLSLKSFDRYVTLEDYAAAAVNELAGVLHANAEGGLYVGGGNPVLLYLVPQGGGLPSDTLKASVSMLTKGLAGKRVLGRDPRYVELLLEAEAHLLPGASPLATVDRVRRAFTERYGLQTVTYGDTLELQDAYNTVDPAEQDIEGLQHVFIRRFTIKPFFGRFSNRPIVGNGSVVNITTAESTPRREWLIRFTTPFGPTVEYTILERVPGRVTGLSATTLIDENSSFLADELVDGGFRLHPAPETSGESWAIFSNSRDAVNITGSSSPGMVTDLLSVAAVGTRYVAERQVSGAHLVLATRGLVFQTTPSASYASGEVVISLNSVTGLSVGDKMLVGGEGGDVVTILDITGLDVTFDAPIAQALTSGVTTFDWYWENIDGSIGFAVVNGSQAFFAGTELFVDTFPLQGDLVLRPADFPRLYEENLRITSVGGRR